MDKKYIEDAREKALDFILIQAAETAGIYDALESPQTAEELSSKLDYDPRAVDIVLRALENCGLLSREGERFSLTGEGKQLFAEPGSDNYIGSSLRHSYHIIDRWLDLPKILRTGRPSDKERDEEGTKAFMHAMDSRLESAVEWTVGELIEKLGHTPEKVVDIGGGPGRYSKVFSEKADLVVLEDRPEVIDYVGAEFGLNEYENIEQVKGDMSVFLPEGPFDIAFLGDICHMWSPGENRNLFKRIGKIVSPGGVLGLVDFVRGYSEWAPVFAVNMLVNTEGGSTYTFDEYREWLEEAGFGNVEIAEVPERDSQLVTAKRR